MPVIHDIRRLAQRFRAGVAGAGTAGEAPASARLGHRCALPQAPAARFEQLKGPRSALVGLALKSSVLMAFLLASTTCLAGEEAWKAGAARVEITPGERMWMSGYGGRDKPAEGKLHELWAKALVLEDPAGARVAWVTLDLVGIDRELSRAIRDRLRERYDLPYERVALCCSHTHTGPVVGQNLAAMYFLDERQQRLVADYTAQLQDRVTGVVGKAISNLVPCHLAWGNGQATFAVNRRNNPEPDVPKLRAEGKLRGPVDHDVPVLSAIGQDGQLQAVLFGYACHATVLGFYQWSGDYPGFAQRHVEMAHPGAVALFFAGCGGDQNPLPRRTVELADEYGRQLATAVHAVLMSEMKPITGQLTACYREVELPLARLPTREELGRDAQASDRFVASRAKRLLDRIDSGQPLRETYPYPVEAWRLGPELLFVALGGEVVVDYALRLKQELGPRTTWVAGYANDVMAYIPSRRVLGEGGYEGGGAMVYYGLPTVWAPEIEEAIVRGVHELAATEASK